MPGKGRPEMRPETRPWEASDCDYDQRTGKHHLHHRQRVGAPNDGVRDESAPSNIIGESSHSLSFGCVSRTLINHLPLTRTSSLRSQPTAAMRAGALGVSPAKMVVQDARKIV